ncbi:DedA family protein [Terracoccus sp. 273MFTsu3.1]|uniref:DedA family protein n=1 Tax=Terracoccus sp. 273MFTsu3.1 TaxID=1172188 RepID=UPI0003A244B7|nr:DedA family protein [Terracoccus sp. 273MFTsu3.1]
MLSNRVDQLLNAPALWVLVVVGAIVFAEDALFVGFILPGETVAILGGVAANRGHVSFWLVLAVVIAAAVIGDSVGFEVGRTLGPRILSMRVLQRHAGRLDDARNFLSRRGGWAVLLGRWVAFFRAVMPALAGTSGMKYRTFLTFNLAGGVLWGSAVVTAGYLAGASYTRVEQAIGKDSALIVLAIVIVALAVWHLRRKRAERSTANN